MKLAPIILFVYNRPEHTRSTINKLSLCNLASQTPLIIFSDAASKVEQEKSVMETRACLEKVKGFQSVQIIYREENLGLARSITKGLNDVFKEHEKVIVLEDDMLVGKHFLEFMNSALDKYANENRVWTVSGYSYNLPFRFSKNPYFLKTSSNQAWATWKRVWQDISFEIDNLEEFKLDHKKQREFNHYTGPDYSSRLIDAATSDKPTSWAILYKWNQFNSDGLTLFSGINLVKNIGWDGSGTNCLTYNPYGENETKIDEYFGQFPKKIGEKRINKLRLVLFYLLVRLKEFFRLRILKQK